MYTDEQNNGVVLGIGHMLGVARCFEIMSSTEYVGLVFVACVGVAKVCMLQVVGQQQLEGFNGCAAGVGRERAQQRPSPTACDDHTLVLCVLAQLTPPPPQSSHDLRVSSALTYFLRRRIS